MFHSHFLYGIIDWMFKNTPTRNGGMVNWVIVLTQLGKGARTNVLRTFIYGIIDWTFKSIMVRNKGA